MELSEALIAATAHEIAAPSHQDLEVGGFGLRDDPKAALGSDMCEIRTYLDDGNVASYDCPAVSGREHAHAIVMTGYRSTDNDTGTLVHYPPHRILKVKVIGGQHTNYPDRWEGT